MNKCSHYLKMQDKSCKLALGTIDNIVAHGSIIELDGPNATIHGIPLGKTNIRVAINVALNRTACLPIPVRDELITVGQAVGSQVAWPKNLVISSSNEQVIM